MGTGSLGASLGWACSVGLDMEWGTVRDSAADRMADFEAPGATCSVNGLLTVVSWASRVMDFRRNEKWKKLPGRGRTAGLAALALLGAVVSLVQAEVADLYAWLVCREDLTLTAPPWGVAAGHMGRLMSMGMM